MGEAQVEAPPEVEVTPEERKAARLEVAKGIAAELKKWVGKAHPVDRNKFNLLVESIENARDYYLIGTVSKHLIELADLMAAATVSKHLAQIALDPNAIKAFCPRCGRHYRYHDRNTGECPVNPFDDPDEK
jgi:hypothetical protein